MRHHQRLKAASIVPAWLYVERDADRQLRRILMDMGRPGYILVARQMGKTNLLLAARRQLQGTEDAFVYSDLSNVSATARECFRTIIDVAIETHSPRFSDVARELHRRRSEAELPPPHLEHDWELRLLLSALTGKLVVILDEVDALTSAPFSDQIFAQIRSTYFSRANYPEFERLTYLLAGVADPADLIKNRNMSPFNIGEKIVLNDFSLDEVMQFVERAGLPFDQDVVGRIFFWTAGNPRMTWDVCADLDALHDTDDPVRATSVDLIIERLYLRSFAHPPVDHIRALMESDGVSRQAIAMIRCGKGEVISYENRNRLYLAGVVGARSGVPDVVFKNPVIDRALSAEWLHEVERRAPPPHPVHETVSRAEVALVPMDGPLSQSVVSLPAAPVPIFDPRNRPFFLPLPPTGERMIGRSMLLARTKEQLDSGRATPTGQTAVLTGPGGIGKTRIAVEYVQEYGATYPGGVVWITADQDVDAQLIRLAKDALWTHPSTESAAKLALARQCLRSAERCLFVFDDVEDIETIRDLLPDPTRNCHVLLTSRREQWGFPSVPVGALNEGAAIEFLRSGSARPLNTDADLHAAASLCRRLAGVPLALELAGAYLRCRPASTINEYADRLSLEQPERVRWGGGAGGPTGQVQDLAHSLSISISAELFRDRPDLEVVLDAFAWGAPCSIGWRLLVALVAPQDEMGLQGAVGLACELRLLQLEDGSGPGSPRFRMHPLVRVARRNQRALADPQGPSGVLMQRLCDWFGQLRQDSTGIDAFEAEQDHLEAWRVNAVSLGDAASAARLGWLQAYPWCLRGEYTRARNALEVAISVWASDPNDGLLEADLAADLGVVLRRLGLYGEAMESAQRALTIRREVLGEHHPETAESYNDVGSTRGAMGDHRKALESQRRALDIRSELFGERHPETATSYDNVGNTYRAMGDHRKALESQLHALAIRREVLGEEHPETATSYDNVGNTYRAMGDHRKALESQLHALAIRREVLGEEHPETATSYDNVGNTYRAMGDHRKALESQLHALAIRRQVLGERQPDTATSYENVGDTYGAMGELAKALESQLHALEVRREVLGDRHPQTATSYSSVGAAYKALGDHRKALESQFHALEVCHEALGGRHPQTVSAVINVIVTLRGRGSRAAIFRLANEALASLPPSTPRYDEIVTAYNETLPAGWRPHPNTPARKGTNAKKSRPSKR